MPLVTTPVAVTTGVFKRCRWCNAETLGVAVYYLPEIILNTSPVATAKKGFTRNLTYEISR